MGKANYEPTVEQLLRQSRKLRLRSRRLNQESRKAERKSWEMWQRIERLNIANRIRGISPSA